MPANRSGFQAQPKQGSKSDFSGDDSASKGSAKRAVLSAMLRMLGETMIKQRTKLTPAPDNDEVDAKEDQNAPEARKEEMGSQAKAGGGTDTTMQRKAKQKSIYGTAASRPGGAGKSSPEGVKKFSKFG